MPDFCDRSSPLSVAQVGEADTSAAAHITLARQEQSVRNHLNNMRFRQHAKKAQAVRSPSLPHPPTGLADLARDHPQEGTLVVAEGLADQGRRTSADRCRGSL